MNQVRKRIYDSYIGEDEESLEHLATKQLSSRAPALRAIVRNHFPSDQDAVILDLGCGSGALVHIARLAGYKRIRGVDVSPQQVAVARKLDIDGVEHGDLLDTLSALPEGSVDLVIAIDVVEHFAKDELLVLFDSVWRVLKQGGRCLVHTPNGDSPFGGAVRYGDLTHEVAFTRSSLEQLKRVAGFSSLECHESGPVVHGFKSFVRAAIWKLIRVLLRVWLAVETGNTGKDAVFTRNFLAVFQK